MLEEQSEHGHIEKCLLPRLIVLMFHLPEDEECTTVTKQFQLVQRLLNELIISVAQYLPTLIVNLDSIVVNDGNQEDHELLRVNL